MQWNPASAGFSAIALQTSAWERIRLKPDSTNSRQRRLAGIPMKIAFKAVQGRHHNIPVMNVRARGLDDLDPEVMNPLDVGRREMGHMRSEREALDGLVLAPDRERRRELEILRRAIPGFSKTVRLLLRRHHLGLAHDDQRRPELDRG